MPSVSKEAHNQLLLPQVLSSLLGTVSQQPRAAEETNDLDGIQEMAKILMTINNPQQTAAAPEKSSKIELVWEQVAMLSEQIAAFWKLSEQQRSKPRHCYSCNRTGHIQRNCPNRCHQ